MSYQRRVVIATVVSVFLHGLFFWIGSQSAQAIPKREFEASQEPIIFQFEPPPAEIEAPRPIEPVKRLISTPIPTTEEVEETDLISDHDSKAQDESDEEGERAAPHVDDPDDFDRIEQFSSQEQPPVPETQEPVEPIEAVEPVPPTDAPELIPEPEPEPEATPAGPESPEVLAIIDETLEEAKPEAERVAEATPTEVLEESEDVVEEQEAITEEQEMPGRFKVAVAQPEPQQQSLPNAGKDLSSFHGRRDGGTGNVGILNFEATKHELGEYMLEVRRLVERRWYTAIQLRYLGIKSVSCLLVCEIRPDGIIEEVRIVEPGPSMPFAVLCRESIVKAGPFAALPFEVPEIYRNQNLEIRWRFSYL